MQPNCLVKWNLVRTDAKHLSIRYVLAAESAIAAQRDSEKIAVEIKSFVGDSDISAFHAALGQYLNYCQALEEQEPDRIVYLAIPVETYQDFFQLPFIQRAIRRYQVNLIIYDPKQQEIKQWIK